MFVENRRFLWLLIPVLVALAIYPVHFDGHQVISLEAPLSSSFEVLKNRLWNFHPFIVEVKELRKINETCSDYQITDRIPFLPLFQVYIPSTYYVQMNVEYAKNCLTSIVYTPWNVLHGYHQYCMHTNTLKPSTTIITDHFDGKSWWIFKYYIRKNMFISHKYTLDKLRKEMMIYASD